MTPPNPPTLDLEANEAPQVGAIEHLKSSIEALTPDQFLALRVLVWRIEKDRDDPDLVTEMFRAKDAALADQARDLGRLKAELALAHFERVVPALQAELTASRADARQLREALTDIAHELRPTCHVDWEERVRRIIFAALTPQDSPGGSAGTGAGNHPGSEPPDSVMFKPAQPSGDSQPKPGEGEKCEHSSQSWYVDRATGEEFCDDCGQKSTHVSVDGAEFAREKREAPEARYVTMKATRTVRPEIEWPTDEQPEPTEARGDDTFGSFDKPEEPAFHDGRSWITRREIREVFPPGDTHLVGPILDALEAAEARLADLDRNLVAFQHRDDRLAELLEGEPEAKHPCADGHVFDPTQADCAVCGIAAPQVTPADSAEGKEIATPADPLASGLCRNCEGTGRWYDITWETERRCPCKPEWRKQTDATDKADSAEGKCEHSSQSWWVDRATGEEGCEDCGESTAKSPVSGAQPEAPEARAEKAES
jgi:hypothetical protein